MSSQYKNSADVPVEDLIRRLNELSDAVIARGNTFRDEFTMRVPAEVDRDADLVLSESATRLESLIKYNAELQAEIRQLKGQSFESGQILKGRHTKPPYLCPDGSEPCGRYGYCSYCPHDKKDKEK